MSDEDDSDGEIIVRDDLEVETEAENVKEVEQSADTGFNDDSGPVTASTDSEEEQIARNELIKAFL